MPLSPDTISRPISSGFPKSQTSWGLKLTMLQLRHISLCSDKSNWIRPSLEKKIIKKTCCAHVGGRKKTVTISTHGWCDLSWKSQFHWENILKWGVDHCWGRVWAFDLLGCNWVKWKRTSSNPVNSRVPYVPASQRRQRRWRSRSHR